MYSHRRALDARFNAGDHLGHHQTPQVVAINPFHFHHANAMAVDEVVNVDQIVLLNLSDAHRDAGHAGHRFVVLHGIVVVARRENFEGNRQRETISPAAFGEIDHALATFAEHAGQAMVSRPVEPLFEQNFVVAVDQFFRPASIGPLAVEVQRRRKFNMSRREHRVRLEESVSAYRCGDGQLTRRRSGRLKLAYLNALVRKGSRELFIFGPRGEA